MKKIRHHYCDIVIPLVILNLKQYRSLSLALGWALKREGGGVVSRAGLPTTRHAAPSCHQAPVAPKEGETLTPKR